eukprot:6220520-Pyramimonas_sp.AAC.1
MSGTSGSGMEAVCGLLLAPLARGVSLARRLPRPCPRAPPARRRHVSSRRSHGRRGHPRPRRHRRLAAWLASFGVYGGS